MKGELGWADFQVRGDTAIRRHWALVCCAFAFCWWAESRTPVGQPPPSADAAGTDGGVPPRERGGKGATPGSSLARAMALLAGSAAVGAGLAGTGAGLVALLAGVVGSPAAPAAARPIGLAAPRPSPHAL